MTAPRFGLTWDEAMEQAAALAERHAARRRTEEARARLGLHHDYLGVWRRWTWRVVDESTGAVKAAGRALTERSMRRRRYAAYLLVLDELADGRAES